MDDEPRFTPEETVTIAEAMMPPPILEIFHEKREVDFAYGLTGTGRFRVNAYFQRGSVALAMRRVRSSAATVDELGLPEVVTRLASEMRGLVLVTGPTGSGKTTTLAAMIDHINHNRSCHVVTIEDPVEYLHTDDLADIDQREVGFDTDSFSSAMRVVLRQDPDVILVGEMRDPDPGQPGRLIEGHHLPAPHPHRRREGPCAGHRDVGGQREDPAGHHRSAHDR
jgi:twitching motility protein PilT